MPRSPIKLPKTLIGPFVLWLQKQEYEVDTSRVDFRALMFRKSSLMWTQGHDGLTRFAKKPRDFLRFNGPEQDAIGKFLEYQFIREHQQL